MTRMATTYVVTTITNDGRVTGYEFTGSMAECRLQIDVLVTALHALMPHSKFSRTTMADRQAMAAVSLQLVGLMKYCSVTEEETHAALATLNTVYEHMCEARRERMRDRGLDETEAGLRTIEDYDYFNYNWDALLAGAGTMRKVS